MLSPSGVDLHSGHEMRFGQAREVLAKIAPCEGQAAKQKHKRNVQVEVDMEVLVDRGGEN